MPSSGLLAPGEEQAVIHADLHLQRPRLRRGGIPPVPGQRQGWTLRAASERENIRAHDHNQTTRLKLCFPYFCWQQAHPLGLEQIVCEATVYQSSATMVHFFQAFRYMGGALPQFAPVSKVIEVANAPLYEMKGQVRRKQAEFPQVL